jgi:capsule polysaccharide modification protein KpsS
MFFFDLDHPGGVFPESQHVELSVNGAKVHEFNLDAGQRLLEKVSLKAAQFGSSDSVDMQITVDKTYVPALLNLPNNKDPRELGVRVFHAYVDPR